MYRHAHWWFLLVVVVVAGGFAPTFFTRLGETALPHMVHGVSSSLWLLLLVTQSLLVTRGGRAWHRRLGWTSLAVFPVMVLSGFYMIRLMLTVRAEDYGPLRYVLAALDIPSLVALCAFYVMALVHRRDVRLHQRYLAATAILLLPPALGRFLAFWVPGIPDLVQALNPMMVLTSLAACVLIWDDRRRGKVYPPYPLTLALMLLVHAFMWRAPESAWWRGLVDGLVGAP